MLRARVSRTRLTPPPAGEAPEPPLQPRVKPARKAASHSRALSAGTLEGLGARRLAELLMDAAQADPALTRSLRLVLAGTDGRGRLAAEVEKRLRTIGRSRGFVEWDKVRPLARELDSLRDTIAGPRRSGPGGGRGADAPAAQPGQRRVHGPAPAGAPAQDRVLVPARSPRLIDSERRFAVRP